MNPVARARQLRRATTTEERKLWRILRGRRFAGYKFRRQVAVGIYFVDFLCLEASLIVELDGGQHGFPDQRSNDEARSRFLAAQGFHVIRFWNWEIWKQPLVVTENIWLELQKRAPHPENQPMTSKGFRAVKSGPTG